MLEQWTKKKKKIEPISIRNLRWGDENQNPRTSARHLTAAWVLNPTVYIKVKETGSTTISTSYSWWFIWNNTIHYRISFFPLSSWRIFRKHCIPQKRPWHGSFHLPTNEWYRSLVGAAVRGCLEKASFQDANSKLPTSGSRGPLSFLPPLTQFLLTSFLPPLTQKWLKKHEKKKKWYVST